MVAGEAASIPPDRVAEAAAAPVQRVAKAAAAPIRVAKAAATQEQLTETAVTPPEGVAGEATSVPAYVCVCHREGSMRVVYARTRRPLVVSLRNTMS